MENAIQSTGDKYRDNFLIKSTKGINIWMISFSSVVFFLLMLTSAVLFIFVRDIEFLVYFNIPNLSMYLITLFLAVKFSGNLKHYNSTNDPACIINAFKYQRRYFLILSAYLIVVAFSFMSYVLFLLLYVRGMN